MIRPDETGTFLMRSGDAYPLGNGILIITPSSIKDKIILLTYSCSDRQEITFLADTGYFNASQKVSGKVLDAQVIDAKFTSRIAPWVANDSNDFPELHLTLTY